MVQTTAEAAGKQQEWGLGGEELQGELGIRQVLFGRVAIRGNCVGLCPFPSIGGSAVSVSQQTFGKDIALAADIDAVVDGPETAALFCFLQPVGGGSPSSGNQQILEGRKGRIEHKFYLGKGDKISAHVFTTLLLWYNQSYNHVV